MTLEEEFSGPFTKKHAKDLPLSPCQYELFDSKKRLLYIGSTCNCQRRLGQQLKRFPRVASFKARIRQECVEARALEKLRCQSDRPPMNRRCG